MAVALALMVAGGAAGWLWALAHPKWSAVGGEWQVVPLSGERAPVYRDVKYPAYMVNRRTGELVLVGHIGVDDDGDGKSDRTEPWVVRMCPVPAERPRRADVMRGVGRGVGREVMPWEDADGYITSGTSGKADRVRGAGGDGYGRSVSGP
jgi:hypothetical protein